MPAPKLVPDPFRPGERVPESMAEVHPSERMAVAVNRRFEAMKKQQGTRPDLEALRSDEADVRQRLIDGTATAAELADAQGRLRAAEEATR